MSTGPAVVAMGGRSLEREVSLRSGHRVERALRSLGYEVQALDVEGDFVERVLAAQPRFVFVAMHGRGGEDGTLQDLLQTLDVPYTGSDPLASALCMDKVLFKRMLRLHGIPTPAFHSFNETAFRELGGARTFPKLLQELGLPAVVKPVAQGSAIGIKFVTAAEQLPSAILGAFGYGDRVLVEERIVGRELAVTVLDRPPAAARAAGPAGAPTNPVRPDPTAGAPADPNPAGAPTNPARPIPPPVPGPCRSSSCSPRRASTATKPTTRSASCAWRFQPNSPPRYAIASSASPWTATA